MDELEVIVQRMIDAGEPEEAIASVIREYKPPPTPEQRREQALQSYPGMGPGNPQWEQAKAHPFLTAAEIAAPMLLGPAATGAKALGRGAVNLAAKYPTATSVGVGAAPGILAGNPYVAVGGAAYGFERSPTVARHLARLSKQMSTPAKAPAPKPPASTLTPQQQLQKEIDWRLTDATPIDAIKRDVAQGGSIIEAGESIPGLSDRLARLLKQPTPDALQEAERLAKALRQRQHITAGTKR